jgi:hypothetical protein
MSRRIFPDKHLPASECTWTFGRNNNLLRQRPRETGTGPTEAIPSPPQFIGIGALGAQGVATARSRYPDAVCRSVEAGSTTIEMVRVASDILMEADRTVLMGAFGDQQVGELAVTFVKEALESRRTLMAIMCLPSRYEGAAAIIQAEIQQRVCLDLARYDKVVQLVTCLGDSLLKRHGDACSLATIYEEISEEMLDLFDFLLRRGHFPVRGSRKSDKGDWIKGSSRGRAACRRNSRGLT